MCKIDYPKINSAASRPLELFRRWTHRELHFFCEHACKKSGQSFGVGWGHMVLHLGATFFMPGGHHFWSLGAKENVARPFVLKGLVHFSDPKKWPRPKKSVARGPRKVARRGQEKRWPQNCIFVILKKKVGGRKN